MQSLAKKVGDELQSRGLTLATAESCTGGGIAQLVTSLAGSSAWFDCGFVTYSNSAKHKMLNVNLAVIEQHGAVSEPVVMQMAENAVLLSDADVAVAVSGIAGPGGGTPEKPVGTIWLAWAIKGHPTVACRSLLQGERNEIRQQCVQRALQGILENLPK
ncbi:CinA family protein [Neptunomonas antarctica]|uniref:Nicotinamide-nucleotide amidase n=1 Tax=Neptunomonas antarctica TaxID=619304 RepID=A0A1N7JB59_9GAMM|nr:CinA family protein [Neptunomonas antarctica]SIS46555.1 nicotinamide-nucleotide amidase [Neptunomonas antarctica]